MTCLAIFRLFVIESLKLPILRVFFPLVSMTLVIQPYSVWFHLNENPSIAQHFLHVNDNLSDFKVLFYCFTMWNRKFTDNVMIF